MALCTKKRILSNSHGARPGARHKGSTIRGIGIQDNNLTTITTAKSAKITTFNITRIIIEKTTIKAFFNILSKAILPDISHLLF